MLKIRMDISRVNGSRDALRNDTYSVKTPPKDGPMNAPAEYNDVNNPEINAYVSIFSGKRPLPMAKTLNFDINIYMFKRTI